MGLEDKSNEELINIIQNNGHFEEASRILYNRNQWLVLRIVGGADKGNPEVVKDLVQEIFQFLFL